KYELAVFCDGKRQGRKPDHSIQVQLAGAQEKMIGIWNDSGNPPGGFSRYEHFKDKFFAVPIGRNTFPLSGRQLADCSILLIVRPDYDQYTARDFSLVLEYAANGGTVIFMDPKGILEAAETPLGILLPVIPLGVRKSASCDFLSLLFPDLPHKKLPPCHEAELLESCEGDREGVTFCSYGPFPLFRQGKFGLGTAAILAFCPEDDAFPASWKVGEKALSLLCRVPRPSGEAGAEHAVLDMLTGFSVLPLSVVRTILAGYFLLLIVILFFGHRRKKQAAAWFVCTAAALAATAVILLAAGKLTDRKKDLIASSVEVENAFDPGYVHKACSLFASGKTFRVEHGSGNEVFSLLSPPRNAFGAISESFHFPEPLKVGRDEEGKGMAEMTVFPKSSRRFSVRGSGRDLFRLQESLVLPEMSLSGGPVKVKKWVLPRHKSAEGVFYVFPGGTRSGTVSADGVCRPELENGVLLSDPMLDALRRSVSLLAPSGAPFLAAVFPARDNSSHQGKRVVLYPVKCSASGGKTLIPPLLVALSPANHSSRMLFKGGFLREGQDLMAEANPEIFFSLPSALRDFVPGEIVITASYSGREHVSLRPKLKIPGKKEFLFPVSARENSWVFRGEDLKKILEPGTATGCFVLESSLTQAGRTLSESAAAMTWSLYDLAVSVRGALPEGEKGGVF
ncbi:MAG: hypothetical protein J6331_10490, partial [Lentisphaeria bacterium]|nr:hypothetical protein [Lentisphaeria bacterium]